MLEVATLGEELAEAATVLAAEQATGALLGFEAAAAAATEAAAAATVATTEA